MGLRAVRRRTIAAPTPTATRSRNCSPTRSAGASSTTCRSACCCPAASTRACWRVRVARAAALQTYTLGFGEPGADERAGARAVAQALGSDHHEGLLEGDEALEVLPELLAAYDEPGQSLVQNRVISRFARTGVTVALSGVGADELFAAYPTHASRDLLRPRRRLPGPLRAGAHARHARRAPGARVRRAAALAAMGRDERVSRALLHETPAALRRRCWRPTFAPRSTSTDRRDTSRSCSRARRRTIRSTACCTSTSRRTYNELLRATDAMSMLHSLEVRTPFLDYRLVELAMRMPAQPQDAPAHGQARPARDGRADARRPARASSAASRRRRRRGCARPPARSVREALSEPAVRSRGIFDAQAVRRVRDGCLAGDAA